MNQLVSVIIPVYNAGLFLEQCLRSVADQTHKNLEIIVIDDGSTDNSAEIIGRFLTKDKRISVIAQKNLGVSEARNVGIASSSGVYLCFIDSDDWISDFYIEKLLLGMSQADLVVTSYSRVSKSHSQPRLLGWSGLYPAREFKRRLLGLIGSELSEPSQLDSMAPVWCKLFKAEIVKSHKLEFVSTRSIGTGEDLLFNLQYIDLVARVIVIDEPLYFYRRDNENSITTIYKSDLFDKWVARREIMTRTVDMNSAEEVAAFDNRMALSIIGLCLNEVSNPAGRDVIRFNVLRVVEDEWYGRALRGLDIEHFPMHWKLFFVSARRKNVAVLIGLARAMSWILNRRRK